VGHVLGVSGEGGGNVAVHGQCSRAWIGQRCTEGKATVAHGIPILGDLVLFLECSEEVHGIVAVGIAYGKVIHNQGKAYIPGDMSP